ncbi:alkaline phosphatase [Nocardioides alcanivorans]|uniref:alkaline phosphatase n=1 Tax=Nocardioides alcanivorans TaxID=2897352 RepID=UPI001F1852B4|nr:alkaline phosphatase [Nocardioides alcanivorans]
MLGRKRFALAAAATAGLVLVGTIAAQAELTQYPTGFSDEKSADLASQIDPSKPRNVILIIGDGMDDSVITAARNYEHGASGRFAALDALPFTGAMTTHGYKAGEGPDYPIAYVSDSAPTASAWSTGKKTIDGRISQGPSTAANVPGEDYGTVLEQFKQDGKLVGNVSTAEITDATPAAAASHINARACQGPADMANCTSAKKSEGGKGSISEQLVDNKIDVLMGGGLNRYNQATDAGPTVKEYAESEHGYRLVEDKDSMEAINSLEDGPVLGLFTGGNMTPIYEPLVAQPGGVGGPDTRCTEADRGDQPSIADMTKKAIELLDNDEGFFLQAESAMIDKQEHASDICGAIGDLKSLDETVQVALDYQEQNPDTLIIVTGDHGHSTQIVGSAGEGRQTATVQTADGDPMTVAYSTAESGSNHTGTQIRVAASGPQAANVTGVIDQTDLFATMLGRTPSEVGTPTPATPKPAASVAAVKKISVKQIKKQGLQVAVAASSATKVKVTVKKGAKTLASKNAPTKGGVVKVKVKNAKKGKLKVVVTATGAGGTATAKQQVKVTK